MYKRQGEYYYHLEGTSFDAISYDSRKVSASTLFFVKGANFKKEYLEQAISNGLGFYVSEKDYEVGIPAILVNDIKPVSYTHLDVYKRQIK